MAILSWRARRQFVYFAIFAVIVGLFLWWAIEKIIPDATCFDGRQNQEEEGIDCGGPCDKKCVGNVREPVIIWARAIKTEKGVYDVASLIENSNLFTGAKIFEYRFKLYDDKNVLIAVRAGETFINPGERFVIFETNIITRERIPSRAVIELPDYNNIDWERIEKEKPKLLVIKKDLFEGEIPRLEARIRNSSLFPIEDIYAVGVIYDEDENVRAISSTKIDFINGESEHVTTFTWPKSFDFIPTSIEVFLRVNSFDLQN